MASGQGDFSSPDVICTIISVYGKKGIMVDNMLLICSYDYAQRTSATLESLVYKGPT